MGEFVDQLKVFYEELRITARDDVSDLHDLFSACEWMPYDQAKRLLANESGNPGKHVGSVTGLFFEQMVSTLVIAYIRRHARRAARPRLSHGAFHNRGS